MPFMVIFDHIVLLNHILDFKMLYDINLMKIIQIKHKTKEKSFSSPENLILNLNCS